MTLNLREITMGNHRTAERTIFLRRILKKTITPYQYYLYISNMFLVYSILEEKATDLGVFADIEVIKRTTNLREDIEELEVEHGFVTPTITDATIKYYDYISNIIGDDYKKILSHVYVRHMGDLSGGQVIKKLVPGTAKHYSFDGDVSELKAKLSEKLSDDLGDEAKNCFDMVVEFLDELEKQIVATENADDMGQTDRDTA